MNETIGILAIIIGLIMLIALMAVSWLILNRPDTADPEPEHDAYEQDYLKVHEDCDCHPEH